MLFDRFKLINRRLFQIRLATHLGPCVATTVRRREGMEGLHRLSTTYVDK